MNVFKTKEELEKDQEESKQDNPDYEKQMSEVKKIKRKQEREK